MSILPAADEDRYPRRIVCLTEEPTEVLYRVGAADRVVGVSGFTVRPPAARKKPLVSSFLDANFERILDLSPDLVIGFSDLQADIAQELIKRGVPVLIMNQRSVAEILVAIQLIASAVGAHDEGWALCATLRDDLAAIAQAARRLPRRPRVFFEEWPDPLISGIRWVSELIELCGGEDVFADRRDQQGAKGRIVDADAVIASQPDVIVGSWCGKMVKPDVIRRRPGFESVPAVRDDHIYEIKSSLILQPGPAALSDGAAQLAAIIAAVADGRSFPPPKPGMARAVPEDAA